MTVRLAMIVLMGLLCLFGAGPVVHAAEAPQRLIYRDRPLALVLRVDHEHRLVFPEPVTIQLPLTATGTLRSLQPTGHTVYWQPTDTLDQQRVLAFSADRQRVYLLDLSATAAAPARDYTLDNPALHRPDTAAPATAPVTAAAPAQNPPAVILTRFAAQTLFAPARLIPADPRIRRVPVAAHPADWPLLRSTQGEHFRVATHAAWRGFGRYVTAVVLINTSRLTVALDLRQVRGDFQHLTAQHTWVGPAGTPNDRTVLYLVSEQPYRAAVQGVPHGF